jgi:hypothetical protein
MQVISRKGGLTNLRQWGEGGKDGTFNREEGLVDVSGSHREVSGKMNSFVLLESECIQYELNQKNPPGGYPCIPGTNADWTVQSGSKPGPQPVNLEPVLTPVLTIFEKWSVNTYSDASQ